MSSARKILPVGLGGVAAGLAAAWHFSNETKPEDVPVAAAPPAIPVLVAPETDSGPVSLEQLQVMLDGAREHEAGMRGNEDGKRASEQQRVGIGMHLGAAVRVRVEDGKRK